jgi:predicted NAD/FAD-binding protein
MNTSNIAVIGSGISGVTVAYLLSQKYNVTLFEKNLSTGGHTCTHVIDRGDDAGLGIDMGFIVCNDRNYPNFLKLLNQWQVALQKSSMSFSYEDLSQNLYYGSKFPAGLLASAKARWSPDFYKMILEIARFNKAVPRFLKNSAQHGQTLGEFLKAQQYSDYFKNHYLLATAAAIWSCPDTEIENYPAKSFFEFFQNHGLISFFDKPQWYSVAGGSHTYLKAFSKIFSGKIFLNSPVQTIVRRFDQIEIKLKEKSHFFDQVVIATHADEALSLLSDPSPDEKKYLGAWRYSQNKTVLHKDDQVMPRHSKIWSSWNYQRQKNNTKNTTSLSPSLTMTYWMNRLQNLKTDQNYFVTLNPINLDESKILDVKNFTHPIYDLDSVLSQKEIQKNNGLNRTFYAGAYLGNGFHEDGVNSAIAVASKLGVNF